MILFQMLVWLICCIFTCHCLSTVCITPSFGMTEEHDPACSQTANINQFCENTGQITDNTLVKFIDGIHHLSATCEIRNVELLTIQGFGKPMVHCEHSSFRFLNVSDLKISNIEFAYCGSNWTHSLPQLRGLYPNDSTFSALLFLEGINLSLNSVVVSHSTFAGIYVINVAGSVTLNSCTINNASSIKPDVMSGNVVVFDHRKHTSLKILNSLVANSGYNRFDHGKCKNGDFSFSYSGGLALFLGNPNMQVVIANSTFSHNFGCHGGSLGILFFKFVPVVVSNSVFEGGLARYGGGVYASFENSYLAIITPQDNLSQTMLRINNSMFVRNYAQSAGGGIYAQWKRALLNSSLLSHGTPRIVIADSTFEENMLNFTSNGGLALHYKVYSDSDDSPNSESHFHVSLDILNCTFSGHFSSNSTQESESGVIVAITAPYLGLGDVVVSSNNCTGILALESILVFHGSTKILNNSAWTGAGIRLCSSSTIYLTPNTNILVAKNSAQHTGGGIQVYTNCLVDVPMCFYQYSREITKNHSLQSTVNVTISNNTARNGGSNVYGGSVDFCYLISYWKRYHLQLNIPNNTMENPSSVTSDPQNVCFTHKHKFHCPSRKYFHIYPGEQITLPLRVAGQYLGSVSGVVFASASGNVSIPEKEKSKTVSIFGENVPYTVFSTSNRNGHGYLTLSARLHSSNDVHMSQKRFLTAKVYVYFKVCPFGFVIAAVKGMNNRFSCQCASNKPSNTSCSILNKTVTKTKNSWLGEFEMDNQSYLAFNQYCPLDYCNNSVQTITSNGHSLNQDEQCLYNRTGILCGSCPKGWSMVLGSSECRKKCSNMWLLLIVPFALTGIIYVIIIHFLNLTVTMGTVCGLIFYANTIQNYYFFLSRSPIYGLTPVLRIFLSVINLDHGTPNCFYDGMGSFGISLLLFVFPIYMWMISAIIIFLSNRYILFAKLVGQNGVKVLATIFLLSYSKMLLATLNILKFKLLTVYIGNYTVKKVRWYQDANIAYFDIQNHLILVLIAGLVIMLLLPFTFSLLCIRHVYSLSNCSRLFSWVDKLKPFFDTYTGPFKDNARFWTGLLLLVRVVLLFLHSMDYEETIASYIVIAVCLFLSATMVFMHGVYKRKCLNVLEYFFIVNISTLFQIHTYKSGSEYLKSVLSHLLISLAFMVALGILFYHVYLKFSHSRCIRRLMRHRSEEMNLLGSGGERSYRSNS